MIFPAEPVTTSPWLGRRYLFRIGRFQVPSYTAMLYLGCVLGVASGAAVAKASGLDQNRFALSAIVLLIPALVGGRLWYVVEHPRLFLAEPRRLWRTQEGGAGLYGGLALSFAASPRVVKALGLPFWSFWDAAAVVMLLGMMVTRFGCLMNGCCAGRDAPGHLGVWLPNHAGQWRRRFPTQLLEAGWSGVLWIAELVARPQLPFAGALFLSAACGYAAGRLALEPLRESAARGSSSTRINLAFSAALLIAAGLALVWPREIQAG